MTLERKLLIVAGAFIIALIIAIGFFSLGLYIGQRDIFPDPPSVTGPGGLPGQPGQAGQQPPGDSGGDPGQPGPGASGGLPGQSGAQLPSGDPNSPRPEVRPSNLPPGPPDLIGPLRTVDANGVTIGTPQGFRLVRLEANTQIFDAQGESLSAEALTIGARLAIFGYFTDDGRTMIAETVIILPPLGGDPPAPQQKTQ